jgi:hypothetical protein
VAASAAPPETRQAATSETILHKAGAVRHDLTRAFGKNPPSENTDRYLCTAVEKKSIMQNAAKIFRSSSHRIFNHSEASIVRTFMRPI